MQSNISGSDNTSVGVGALGSNTTASFNTAVGKEAGYSNSTGTYNVFLGYQAGKVNTTGGYNTVVGYKAGITATTANFNTYLGTFAGELGSGGKNTFVGNNAGVYLSSGNRNTILGRFDGNQGGLDIRTSSNNIVLSDGDGNPRIWANSAGRIVTGTLNTSQSSGDGVKLAEHGACWVVNSGGDGFSYFNATAGAYRFYVLSSGQIAATYTSISAISDQRLKENVRDLDVGLDEVLALRPRTFDWKAGKGKDQVNDRGFIAQEIEQVFPDLVDEWKDESPEGEEPYKSVRQDLIPVLVKAIQELSSKNDELEARITALENA